MSLTAEDIYTIRLLVNDLPSEDRRVHDHETIFSDRDIELLASLEPASVAAVTVRRVAARLLRRMATDENLLSKKITTQDLSVDGVAVAAELRAQANALDAEAARIHDEGDPMLGAWFEPMGECRYGSLYF